MTSLDLKILADHPVQYQAPLFKELVVSGLRIEVGYCHPGTAGRVARDAEFGIDFAWDMDLLSGYPYRTFLPMAQELGKAEQVRMLPQLLRWACCDRRTPLLLIGWFAPVVWLVWLLRILMGAPTLVFGDSTLRSFAASPKSEWRLALLRWLLHRTAACLFVGANNRALWTSLGVSDRQLFCTPHSIDNARFAAEAARLLPQREEFCRQYGLDPVLPTFLFCGKLIPKKRPLQILNAYLASNLQARAQLLYVGEGALRPELEGRVREAGAQHVHLLGFLNQTQMPLAYVLGEVLCLVSDATETWGLVVNEAMACGRPVIVSEAVGCAPDLVRRENGWVVPLDDHAALTGALTQAFMERELWPAMGNHGRDIVAHHTYADMVAGIKTALSHLGTTRP